VTALELRRARPLLGTFVEIVARADNPAAAGRAVSRAFAEVEILQALLSAHDPASEVSRLNREAHAQPVAVGRDTWRVLRAACRLSRQSEGAFDVTLEGGSRDIVFATGMRVRFARPLRIDLGGIAKGYCVDRAVAALMRGGIESGLVNAGGDVRAFGPHAFALHLRHPCDPAQLFGVGEIRNAALATSASYATGGARCAGQLRDGRSGAPIRPGLSVSVRASSALLADALTKVVAAARARAEPLLARYGAHAWVYCAQSGREPSPAVSATGWETPCAAAA
jgi:thiamine biosynthesis lipoprotein